MSTLLILPILIPLVFAALSLCAWKSPFAQRLLGVLGTGLLLVAAIALFIQVYRDGVIAGQMGNWPAPFGITLVADLFAAIMVLLAGMKGFGVAIYSLVTIDERRVSFGYYPLLMVLLMGVCGAFLTGDIFNLYVWFEVMLMASFVLLTLGGERGQMEGAIKYVTLNLMSSAIFLAAIGILYGMTGTLNMADLAVKLGDSGDPKMVTVVSMLFLVAFGVKAAVFPLFFWLPASYHTPPVAVSAIFAGLLTKVGVYALIRVFTLIFNQEPDYTHTLILAIAGLTMVTGVLGAAAQYDIRRILSFHIVSQIGYMLMGLGLYTPLAIAGSVFYIMHHIIVKTNLFLIAGVVERLQGSGQLKKIGGVYRSHPMLSIWFLIPAMSLAGIPPLSGFWAKFVLVKAGLEVESYVIVATALAVGLLTLFSMTKIWSEAFWKPRPEDSDAPQPSAEDSEHRWYILMLPIVVFALCTASIGLFIGPLFAVAMQAADQLMDPQVYIDAVKLYEAPTIGTPHSPDITGEYGT